MRNEGLITYSNKEFYNLDAPIERKNFVTTLLDFSGGKGTFGSPYNGNVLAWIQLDKSDPFLANYIKHYGSTGCGEPPELSKRTDGLIHPTPRKVRGSTVDVLRKADFSLSVASTPDPPHVDQLVLQDMFHPMMVFPSNSFSLSLN